MENKPRLIHCFGCGMRRKHIARRLCQKCYDQHKKDFPRLFHSMGLLPSDENENIQDMQRKPPAAPTMARPGTEEKIQVLMRRHENNEQLWHPHDCLIPSERGENSAKKARPGMVYGLKKGKRRDGGWHNSPAQKIFTVPDDLGIDLD